MITRRGMLIAMILLLPAITFAQQPGTTAYNTVFLPAHGAGDTLRPYVNKWGAWAKGEDGALGWTFSGRTEREARRLALEDCAARGIRRCKVEKTFANGCAALAKSTNDRRWQIAPDNLDWVRQTALSGCGPDCKIVFEGCAIP